jgi:O-antigen biosynthesis protein
MVVADNGTSRAAMKVFGIGLPRTGTTSLAAATLQLGFRTGHTCFREAIFDGGQAFFNTPVYADYPLLDVRYPGSKFILTWRTPERWCDSFCDNLLPYLRVLRNSNPGSHPRLSELDRRCFIQVFGAEDITSRELLIARYWQHRRDAEAYFARRPDDLLVLAIDEPGDVMDRLCRFLGRPRPDWALPHLNSAGIHAWGDIRHDNKLPRI